MKNADELVARVWEEAAARAASIEPLTPDEATAPEALALDGQLAYLNQHWAFATSPATPASSRARRTRERVARLLAFPSRYFAEEREFLAHTVRFANEVARRTDDLAAADTRLRRDLRAEARRLADRDQTLHDLLEARVAALEARVAELEARAP